MISLKRKFLTIFLSLSLIGSVSAIVSAKDTGTLESKMEDFKRSIFSNVGTKALKYEIEGDSQEGEGADYSMVHFIYISDILDTCGWLTDSLKENILSQCVTDFTGSNDKVGLPIMEKNEDKSIGVDYIDYYTNV